MDTFSTIAGEIVRLLDGAASGMDWIPLMLIFAAVVSAVMGAFMAMRPDTNIVRGITRIHDMTSGEGAAQSLRNDQMNLTFDRVLQKLEKYLVQTNEKERSTLRSRMMQAGYYGERAARICYIIRVVLAVTLPVGFLYLSPDLFPDMKNTNLMLIAGGLALAGLYLPYRYIESRVESRQLAITESFPESLDLLVICVEAGLALDAAFVRVTKELTSHHPILAEQLGLVSLELKMGKTRADALRNLATRTGVNDVKYFVTLLIQSEELGADLGETLRIQADEMRSTRMSRAEENANKLPVKLAVALVMFILPAMFVVVLGPAMISIARDVLPHLGN